MSEMFPPAGTSGGPHPAGDWGGWVPPSPCSRLDRRSRCVKLVSIGPTDYVMEDADMANPVKHKPWVNPWNPSHVVGKPSPAPSSGKGGKGKGGSGRKGGSRGGTPGGS